MSELITLTGMGFESTTPELNLDRREICSCGTGEKYLQVLWTTLFLRVDCVQQTELALPYRLKLFVQQAHKPLCSISAPFKYFVG